jgi:hypothetical protein
VIKVVKAQEAKATQKRLELCRELHERNQIGVKATGPRNSSLFRGFVVPFLVFC